MNRKRSKQRERLLELLRSTETHPTAEWLYERLRKELTALSMGTVYRNLNILVEEGSVQRIDLADASAHFDANTAPHYHLICEQCDAIIDLPLPVASFLDRQVNETTRHSVSRHRIEFYGLCNRCQER